MSIRWEASRKYKLKKDLLYFPEIKTNCYSGLKGTIVNRTYAPFSKWNYIYSPFTIIKQHFDLTNSSVLQVTPFNLKLIIIKCHLSILKNNVAKEKFKLPRPMIRRIKHKICCLIRLLFYYSNFNLHSIWKDINKGSIVTLNIFGTLLKEFVLVPCLTCSEAISEHKDFPTYNRWSWLRHRYYGELI